MHLSYGHITQEHFVKKTVSLHNITVIEELSGDVPVCTLKCVAKDDCYGIIFKYDEMIANKTCKHI